MYSSNSGDNIRKSTMTPQGIPVVSAGNYYPGQAGAKGPWATGLYDCFLDNDTCCLTFWCPCITFGRIAEILDKGETSCVASGALYAFLGLVTKSHCCYSCFYRRKLRQQYMLPETPCGDCFVHCCCEPCALCQEYNELKRRGFDMSMGWHGNMERQNRGVGMSPMTPVVREGMTR